MKKLILATLLAGFAAFAWWSLPSAPPPGAAGEHANHGGEPAALSDGVVLAINRPAGNVTISHGPLLNLGMPAMTMGFQVGDPSLLERLKPGDKVRFHADVVEGAFTAMKIEPAN